MKISVVIPLYNKKDTVIRAIDSVLNQTFSPFEVIIINDGSTDDSINIVKQKYFSSIFVIDQINMGVSAARNKGIEESSGDWVAFLDADDYWEEDFLSTIVALHGKFKDANVLATSYRYVDSGLIYNPVQRFLPKEGYINNYFKAAYSGSPPLWTGAICIKKTSLIKIGSFPVGVKIGEDLLTWARLAINERIAFSDLKKSNYSFPINVNQNITFRLPDEPDIVGQELKKILRTNLNGPFLKDIKKYISHWYKMRLHLYIHNRNRKNSITEYLNCLKYNIFNIKAHFLIIYSLIPSFIVKRLSNRLLKSSFK